MSTPAAPPAPRQEGGGGNVLQQRIGPLATWVWLLIGTVLVLGYAYYRNRKAAASTTGQATAGQTVPTQSVPDIIIQNQEGPGSGETPPPPPGAVPPGPPAPTPPPPTTGGGSTKPPAKPPAKPPTKPSAKGPAQPQYKIITVARWTPTNTPWNSTLWGIATHEGVKGGYQALAKLNGIKDANLIRPGQKIRVPVS